MCPQCHEPMVVFEWEGIEIDRCVVCRGTWLDAGELEQILERGGVAPGTLVAAVQAAGDGQRGGRRCPRCRRKMRVITLGAEPGVQLDRCPIGHGLWLDRGELGQVVSIVAGHAAAPVAMFLADLLRYDLAEPA